VKGLHAIYLIDIGVKLGFFEKVADAGTGGLTARELAAASKTHPDYTQFWCQAAAGLELVECVDPTDHGTRDSDAKYALAPFMDELLARKDGNYYIGGFPAVALELARDYRRVPDLFRSGKTFPYQKHDKRFFVSVAMGLKTLPKIFLALVLPEFPDLMRRLEQGANILDIGCGGGHALVEIAKNFPRTTCLGVDIEPNSIMLARRLIRKNKLQKRVRAVVVKGNQEYGRESSFDLATLFLALHEISPKMKQRVIDSTARALVPGGTLLIYDEAYPERMSELKSEPQIFAVMAQWFEGTWGNVVNTSSEIKEMVSRAGLVTQNERNFSRFYILTATKPS
jgi:ubiquinone/menaquinone biosynthesis C-methylase UbiE